MTEQSDKSLDDRLHSADPAAGKTKTAAAPGTPPSRNVNALRGWWLTTSSRVRRSMAGSAAVAASATVVASMTLNPIGGGPLIYLAEGSGVATQNSTAVGASLDSKMMMPYVEYEYLAGAGLSAASGRGHVYRLELAGTAESVARRAADYLDVEGEFGKSMYFDANWPTYVIGSEDGTAPAVIVGWSGTGSWWYNNPDAYPEQKCLSEKKVGKGANAYVECLEYEPAESGKNPDESETRTLATEFFTAMGVPFDAADVSVSVDEWSSYATVALTVGGQKTALEWSISWSGNGEIAWAQGNSVTVVDAGEFDTVSDVAAVDRLADWRWYGAGPTDLIAGGPAGMLRSATYDGLAVGGDGAEASTEPSEPAPEETPVEPVPEKTEAPVEPTPTDEPVVEPTEEPAPLPTEPEMEVVTVTIDEAKPALLLIWDQSGNAWLVPGVALTGADWWWQTVITLVEGVIELPEPVSIMPID